MSKNAESDCSCGCSGKGGSTGRAMLAGAFGGVVGVAVVGWLTAAILRRMGPEVMPRIMERLMGGCDCCPETKQCMGRGDCGGSCDCGDSCGSGESCDCGGEDSAAPTEG
jgi:hypothetical protein